MENEREVLLEVNHLNVTYGSGKKAYEAVQDANFKIYKGETFGLVGESGSGKTTIGRAILRILPTSGCLQKKVSVFVPLKECIVNCQEYRMPI